MPSSRKGSRLSEIVSTHSTSVLGSMPRLAASTLAISTSKPVGMSEAASLNPRPGWSYFTPILTAPASASSFMRVPSSKSSAASSATSTSAPSVSSPASPQAASDRASPVTAMTALVLVNFMWFSFCPEPNVPAPVVWMDG